MSPLLPSLPPHSAAPSASVSLRAKSMMEGRPQTKARRQKQASAVKKIVTDRFGANAGSALFAIVGDFNDYLDPGNGIASLVNWNQVENVFERLPQGEQWTHFWSKKKEYRQLDYVLLSKALAAKMAGNPTSSGVGSPSGRRGSPGRASPGSARTIRRRPITARWSSR